MPQVQKDVHFVYLANTLAHNSMIVFTRTVHDTQRSVHTVHHFYTINLLLIYCRLSLILRTLGFPAVPLHGQLSQSARLGALTKFKSGGKSILVATDVASR